MGTRISNNSAHLQVYFRRYCVETEALLDALRTFSEAQLNRRPPGGGWSAIQVLHHLILTEELSMTYVRKKLQFAADLETAGLRHRWRVFQLWCFLNLPFRFAAPAVVAEENLPESATLVETAARWKAIHTEWDQFIGALPAEWLDKAVYRHPLVGRLSWKGAIRFFHFHFRRHRRQIMRTLEAQS